MQNRSEGVVVLKCLPRMTSGRYHPVIYCPTHRLGVTDNITNMLYHTILLILVDGQKD